MDNKDKVQPNIVEELRKHLRETPQEQLDKEWEELKEWGKVGPTVDEFLNEVKNTPKHKFLDTLLEKYPYNKEVMTKEEECAYKQGLTFGFSKATKLLENEYPKRIWNEFVKHMLKVALNVPNNGKNPIEIPNDVEENFYKVNEVMIRQMYENALESEYDFKDE